MRIADGRDFSSEPYGGPPGTTVTVEHLFANVPARLKFLKQPATEAGHIQQIVTRYALAFPERRFSLVSDGRLVFQSTGSGKLYDVLVKVYGLEMAQQMLRRWATRTRAGRAAGTGPRVSGLRGRALRSTVATAATSRCSSTAAGFRTPRCRTRHPGLSHPAAGGPLSRWQCSSSRSIRPKST